MAVLDPQYMDAIKGIEGYAPQAAWDYKQYSSGYGTKAQPGDENIPQDQRQAVYEQRFQDEVAKAAAHVDSVAPNLPPGVRAALTSLTYNAGPGWSQSGLGEAVRAGDWDKAKTIFQQYNKAGGEVSPGLVARRAKEAVWFDSGLPGQTAAASPAPTPAPASGPLNILPPTGGMLAGNPMAGGLLQAPVAPQAPPQAPQQQASAQPAAFEQIPQMQAPPIFYAPRRSPDISKLRTAFKAPVFPSRG